MGSFAATSGSEKSENDEAAEESEGETGEIRKTCFVCQKYYSSFKINLYFLGLQE